MQLKKLLALLLSAALALSLLAGCGGESVARSLLALLDGQYANVSVEMDPDLEADLRQALSETENDDEAVIRAALETLLGSTITFRYLGEGQQGDTAFDLIFYAGADPDKAAQSAYSQWNGTFSNLPDDGLYTAALAQVQTENGVWLLVQATVDKAGTVDKPDKDDDEPEPEKPKDPYTDNGNNSYTVNTKDGLQELFNDKKNDINKDTVIKLTAGKEYTVNQQLAADFKGTLQGEDETNKATITLTGGNGLFAQISGGTVENITFEVQTNISNTYSDGGTTRAGAVAGQNNGTIRNCDVTINVGYSITANGGGSGRVYAGGIAGENRGKIIGCNVKGSYKSTDDDADAADAADDISAANGDNATCAGGIAGYNQDTVKDCSVSDCKIKAGDNGNPIAAGGHVGLNENGNVDYDPVTGGYPVTGCYYITATARNAGSATVTNNSEGSTASNQNAFTRAGTKIGFDEKDFVPVGW